MEEEADMKDLVPEEATFKKPEGKFWKYKPRKSRELEKELSMSEMEFVTSVQVHDDNNSKMTSRSTTSQLSQASSISLVRSFDISGINHLENSLDPPRDIYDFSNIEFPKVLNDEGFEDLLYNITVASRGEKSILLCSEEHCRGTMQFKENSILICRKCKNTRNQKNMGEYQKPELTLSESLENFGKNFQKPVFNVDLTVLDKYKNQPTFGEIFQKIKDIRSAVRTHEPQNEPFNDWIDGAKDKLKEMTREPIINVNRLVICGKYTHKICIYPKIIPEFLSYRSLSLCPKKLGYRAAIKSLTPC